MQPSKVPNVEVKNKATELAITIKINQKTRLLSSKSLTHYFVMTVDVDGWSSLLSFYAVDHDSSQADAQVNVKAGIFRLLDLFEKHNILATFFVTGEMARKHSKVVRAIRQKGHEVACHGLIHGKNECLLSRIDQKRRIEEATSIIKEKIGVRPVGFRAPCLRANTDTMAVLLENDYLYDSSLIPTFIPGYYGHLNSSLRPYRLSLNFSDKGRTDELLEIPVSVNPIIPFPLSAAWMRNLGFSWVKFGVKMNFFFGNPVVFYVHPRDVLSLPKVKGVPWHVYRNVGFSAVKMLDGIIKYVKSLEAVFVRAVDLAVMMHVKVGDDL